MKTELESKTIYGSDDGKKRSYSQSEIEAYEKRQLKEIFERRTKVANVSVSTSLYCFANGDVKSFKNFYPEVYLEDIEDDERGYFVCVYDSSYDDIGENYHLYHERDYKDLIQEKIDAYKNILDRVTNRIATRKTSNFREKN